MKKILLSAIVIAAIVGCSKRNVTEPVPDSNAIVLGSGFTATSNANSKAALFGDMVVPGLQFLRLDVIQGLPAPTDFTNGTLVVAEREAGGNIKWGAAQYYNATTTTSTYFASYYPQATVAGSTATWTIDGKKDIMTAGVVNSGNNITKETPTVAYKHELAQVQVICVAENTKPLATIITHWGKITGIKMKATKATMDYSYATLATSTAAAADGDVAFSAPDYTANFTPVDIAATTSTTVVAAGMFAPAGQTFQLEITSELRGVQTATVDLKAPNKLEKGKKHIITCTFGKSDTDPIIIATSTIEAWGTGANGGVIFN